MTSKRARTPDKLAPPPPSFNSFPDFSTRQSPPTFSSFPGPPSTSTPQQEVDSRPLKKSRPTAADFLGSLEDDLRAEGKLPEKRKESKEDRSESRRHHHSRDERRSNKDRDRKSSEKRKETREDDYDEHHKSSRDKGKSKEPDYGHTRGVPYQMVQAPKEEQLQISTKSTPKPLSEKPTFCSDTAGDEFNIRFGGLNKREIPRYRRLGGGRIVGLNSGLRIAKETAYQGRDLEVGPNVMARTPRYADPRSARHTSNNSTKRIIMISQPRPVPVLGQLDLSIPEDPFLPSSSDPTRFVAFEREVSSEEKISQLEHEEGTDYRSIAGLIKPSDLDPEDEEEDEVFDGLGVSGGESRDQYFKRRNIEMDRALRMYPTDVPRWIEFVDFQDEVSLSNFIGSASKRALSKAERTSTCEIKLSILDRALAVEGNDSSEDLLLLYLKTVAEVWDAKVVLDKWKETLRKHPTMTGLWIEYVSWRQTNSANFTVRDVVDVFVDCFKVLSTSAVAETLHSSQRELLEGNSIYLFLRLCLMLRQAGFNERAFAAFQALLELNLFRPVEIASPQPRESELEWRERALTDLESFWDEESPRIGEAGAAGWRNRPRNAEALSTPPSTLPDSKLTSEANRFERWVDAEERTTQSQPRPARTIDPGVDDDIDPFRVVLFDDVRDFMMIFRHPDSHMQMIYAFLTFLRLPFMPPDCPTSTPFTTDPFIHSELAESPEFRARFWPSTEVQTTPFDTLMGEAMEPERRGGVQEPFETPFHATPVSVDLLFGTKQKWFRTLRKEDLAGVDVEVARYSFELLQPLMSDSFLTLHRWSFEAAHNVKAAVKVAKAVLRAERQSLVLWDGYARLDRQRGKLEDARNTCMTALSMSRSFQERGQIDAPLLWRAWAEMEWEDGNALVALKVLIASTAPKAEELKLSAIFEVDPDLRPPSGQILRARQSFSLSLAASFSDAETQATLRNRNHVAFNFALFQYLSQGLAAAVDVLENHLFQLESSGSSGSAEQEEILMAYVKLLYRNANTGKGYKPSEIRDVVERAIKAFPHNTLFLSVFYHNELRRKIQNRVRWTLEHAVLAESKVTFDGWLFAIFAELHLDARSHSAWGVRNLFDRAVDNPRTRPSVSIWTLYIEFEIRNGELSRAKSLVYRAIRECPWCRELYFKPFSAPLRSKFSNNELRSLHGSLLEKGLRLRIELDGFDDGNDSDIEMGDEEKLLVMNEGTRDAEVMFEERARLMPY